MKLPPEVAEAMFWVKPRSGCLSLQRDGFGLWPADNFWQGMPNGDLLPEAPESGLFGMEEPACPTVSSSPWPGVRREAVHAMDRWLNRTSRYCLKQEPKV